MNISVYDMGRGISAEHLPHLCNEFYRVREERDQDIEGVGLGLSIVKRIATLLKVQIRIRSRLGKGTTVVISGLPIVAARQIAPLPDIDWNKRLLGGLRVLLIEDNYNVLQATAMLLRKWGCEVQTASAIPRESVDCDLVVTDFDLDRSPTGADCISYLSELHGRRIPAIVITGHAIESVQKSSLLLNFKVESGTLRRIHVEQASP